MANQFLTCPRCGKSYTTSTAEHERICAVLVAADFGAPGTGLPSDAVLALVWLPAGLSPPPGSCAVPIQLTTPYVVLEGRVIEALRDLLVTVARRRPRTLDE